MKPRLRFYRGEWHCGTPGHPYSWSCAPTPREAYELWAYVFLRAMSKKERG